MLQASLHWLLLTDPGLKQEYILCSQVTTTCKIAWCGLVRSEFLIFLIIRVLVLCRPCEISSSKGEQMNKN